VLKAFRLNERDATKSYTDLHKALGQAKSWVPASPDVAATETAWWLATIKPAGKKMLPEILRQYPALAQGRHADEERQSSAFTPFDGHVPEAGKVLDPCALPYGISASTLEGAASCGFKHFLERGLRIEAVDTDERDADVWLDPMTRGGVLHDLYAAVLRRSRDAKRQLDRSQDGTWLLDKARALLHDLRVEVPPPSEEVFERECRDLLADLELFLDAECKDSTRTPIGLEVSFGPSYSDDDGYVEPLAQAEPVEIGLGGGLKFRVRGRIDRINQIGPSEFEVVDYKTGTYWAPSWKGVFSAGTRLQHAIYGLAALALLKPRYPKAVVSGGTYYFPSARGGQQRHPIEAPSKKALAGVLGDLRAVIAKGAFIHTGDKDECRFCDFGAACGARDAIGRVKDKLENDAKLSDRVRLATHE
jgi:ATP-dependent helicase/nuclease subunit B